MRKIHVGIAFLALSMATPAAVLRSQHTCQSANGNSDHFKRVINAMMATDQAAVRKAFGLPLVSPSQVSLVSDATVCARAGQALDSLSNAWVPVTPLPPPSTGPLYVIAIGSYYAVIDLRSTNSADADYIYFFGPLWDHKGVGASE